MTALVVALALFAWVWWLTRTPAPAPPARPARACPAPARPAPAPARHSVLVLAPSQAWVPPSRDLPRVRPSVRPDAPPWPLTEDDLIAFGVELEQTEDVLAELVTVG